MKRSKYHSTLRRHTDAGEHAFSINLAKNEYSTKILAPTSIDQPHHILINSNTKPGIFRRLFRSKSFKHNQNNMSEPFLCEKSILDNETIDKHHKTSIFLLFQNQIAELPIAPFPTFEWLYSNFTSVFNIHSSKDFSLNIGYLIKSPDSPFFESLLQLTQLVVGSTVSIYLSRNYDSSIKMDDDNNERKPKSTNNIQFLSGDEFRSTYSPSESLILLSKRLRKLRNDLSSLKWTTLTFQEEYRILIKDTSESIKRLLDSFCQSTLISSDVPHFRFERNNIHSLEMNYFAQSSGVYNELELIDRTIENIRVDVSERRSHILLEEVEHLNSSLSVIGTSLITLKKHFLDLEPNLKRIMALELEVIVREEDFVKNEEFRLEESIFKCRQLNSTLIALRKLCNIQNTREAFYFELKVNSTVTSEMWQSLMDEIRTLKIDHIERLKSIELSNQISKRKKYLNFDPMKAFTRDLQEQRKFLRRTNNIHVINNRNNLIFHKWLEEYRREKFIQRSNQKQSLSSNFHIKPTIQRESKMSNIFFSNRNNVNSYMLPQVSQQPSYMHSFDISFNTQATFNHHKFNDSLIQQKNQYTAPFLLSVPGPTPRSNNSEKYLTRPQVYNTEQRTKLSNPIQQFSVV